ncbi:MAG: hypothetical protein ACKOXO_05805 [Cyanobium sp.]
MPTPFSPLERANGILRAFSAPFRLRKHRRSRWVTVYEFLPDRRTRERSLPGCEAANPEAVEALCERLLAAAKQGLTLEAVTGTEASAPRRSAAPCWSEICEAVVAFQRGQGVNMNLVGPFKGQGYFRLLPQDRPASLEDVRRFALHTSESLKAQLQDPSEPLLPMATHRQGFRQKREVVSLLRRAGFGAIAPQELSDELKAMVNRKKLALVAAGQSRRRIPTTEAIQQWLDLLQQENPLRGWVMAVIACYGLRPHEVWHIERLPGESSVEPTFLQISMFEGGAGHATKTGHRFALPLPESWLERYRLNDLDHSRAMLSELRRRHPIRTAEAADGSLQFWNNARLGREVVHWLRYSSKPYLEIKNKLLGWHQPRGVPGRRQPPPIQGRCKAYDLRHAWAIRARETTTWSTALKAQAIGHSETIHARRYRVEQTALQIERGMALQKALDEGPVQPQGPERLMVEPHRPTPPAPSPAAADDRAATLPPDITPELLQLARQLMALSGTTSKA